MVFLVFICMLMKIIYSKINAFRSKFTILDQYLPVFLTCNLTPGTNKYYQCNNGGIHNELIDEYTP